MAGRDHVAPVSVPEYGEPLSDLDYDADEDADRERAKRAAFPHLAPHIAPRESDEQPTFWEQ